MRGVRNQVRDILWDRACLNALHQIDAQAWIKVGTIDGIQRPVEAIIFAMRQEIFNSCYDRCFPTGVTTS